MILLKMNFSLKEVTQTIGMMASRQKILRFLEIILKRVKGNSNLESMKNMNGEGKEHCLDQEPRQKYLIAQTRIIIKIRRRAKIKSTMILSQKSRGEIVRKK